MEHKNLDEETLKRMYEKLQFYFGSSKYNKYHRTYNEKQHRQPKNGYTPQVMIWDDVPDRVLTLRGDLLVEYLPRMPVDMQILYKNAIYQNPVSGSKLLELSTKHPEYFKDEIYDKIPEPVYNNLTLMRWKEWYKYLSYLKFQFQIKQQQWKSLTLT